MKSYTLLRAAQSNMFLLLAAEQLHWTKSSVYFILIVNQSHEKNMILVVNFLNNPHTLPHLHTVILTKASNMQLKIAPNVWSNYSSRNNLVYTLYSWPVFRYLQTGNWMGVTGSGCGIVLKGRILLLVLVFSRELLTITER